MRLGRFIRSGAINSFSATSIPRWRTGTTGGLPIAAMAKPGGMGTEMVCWSWAAICPLSTPPNHPAILLKYGLHHQGAMWESYDDSPMWGYYTKGISVHPRQFWGEKGVNYVFRTSTLNLNTLVANSMYALSADMLVRIARELGYTEDESVFREQYRRIRKLINEHFWDPETGTYRDRFWKSAGGHLSSRKSPVMFYTMAAGVPTREQADRPRLRGTCSTPKSSGGSGFCPQFLATILPTPNNTTGAARFGRLRT